MADDDAIFEAEGPTDEPIGSVDQGQVDDQGGAKAPQGEGSGEAQAQSRAQAKTADAGEKRKFKLKVLGEELEEELDLKNEKKLVEVLQKAKTFDKRSNQIAQQQKQIEQFMQAVKSADLVQLAKMKGMDERQLEEFAAQHLLGIVKRGEMTPEQRELEQLKAEKAQREQMEIASKQEVLSELAKYMELPPNAHQYPKEQLVQALEAKRAEYSGAEENLDKEIAAAWADSGLPKTKAFVTMIAQELYGASLRKQDLTAKEASAIVKENWHRNVKETLDQMDAQAIHELLGEAVLKKLRKYDVDRVSLGTSQAPPKIGSARKPESQGTKKQMDEHEWRDHFEKRLAEL